MTRTAAVFSKKWLSARDAFHGHIFRCKECAPQVGRYCAAGIELKLKYEDTPANE